MGTNGNGSLFIMLAVMAIVFIALNAFSKRANQKRVNDRERMLQDEMVPGVWVHTSVGFFGRFVDLDGDVLILETPGGQETYWNKAVIRSVGDLPFEADEDDAASEASDLATSEGLPPAREEDSDRKE